MSAAPAPPSRSIIIFAQPDGRIVSRTPLGPMTVFGQGGTSQAMRTIVNYHGGEAEGALAKAVIERTLATIVHIHSHDASELDVAVMAALLHEGFEVNVRPYVPAPLPAAAAPPPPAQ